MKRADYLDLAASGLRMPIGTDLLLREQPDEEAILHDGSRLGHVVEAAARRYGTPLAFPLMDLTVEKEALLTSMGVAPADIPTFHFASAPDPCAAGEVRTAMAVSPTSRMAANAASIQYIAEQTDLVPCGMSIGPFSFMTKLLADPISPVYLSGSGVTAEDDAEVHNLESTLDLALAVILESVAAQIRAGARAIIVCEPAASSAFLSPKQLAKGSDIFERFVLRGNLKIRDLIAEAGAELIFHDCGELTPGMVSAFAKLDPVMLSLGSSRNLWEDAALVPNSIVLYGNLPTKRFYSPDMTLDEVRRLTCELTAAMQRVGHPFILGSECDVLSVPDVRAEIADKVDTFLNCSCG